MKYCLSALEICKYRNELETLAGLASKDSKQSVFLANLSFWILNFSQAVSIGCFVRQNWELS